LEVTDRAIAAEVLVSAMPSCCESIAQASGIAAVLAPPWSS
jgi:hypothetical protein